MSMLWMQGSLRILQWEREKLQQLCKKNLMIVRSRKNTMTQLNKIGNLFLIFIHSLMNLLLEYVQLFF